MAESASSEYSLNTDEDEDFERIAQDGGEIPGDDDYSDPKIQAKGRWDDQGKDLSESSTTYRKSFLSLRSRDSPDVRQERDARQEQEMQIEPTCRASRIPQSPVNEPFGETTPRSAVKEPKAEQYMDAARDAGDEPASDVEFLGSNTPTKASHVPRVEYINLVDDDDDDGNVTPDSSPGTPAASKIRLERLPKISTHTPQAPLASRLNTPPASSTTSSISRGLTLEMPDGRKGLVNDPNSLKVAFEVSLYGNGSITWQRASSASECIQLIYGADGSTLVSRQGAVEIVIDPSQYSKYRRDSFGEEANNSIVTLLSENPAVSSVQLVFDRGPGSSIVLGKAQARQFLKWLQKHDLHAI
jgi:hypothetical protein